MAKTMAKTHTKICHAAGKTMARTNTYNTYKWGHMVGHPYTTVLVASE